MNKYVSPEFKITLFDGVEVICASVGEEPATTPATKQEVTGDGPGIVLPDDEW